MRRRPLHVQGGARRLRDRLLARPSSPRSCSPASASSAARCMPFAIAANAVPIIAFAPITNHWFGLLEQAVEDGDRGGPLFFPVLVNTLRGLTSVRPSSIELMRSYAAGEVRDLPPGAGAERAAVHLFTALKVATVLAMIGAIVGEYFRGSQEALGVPDPELGRALRLRARLGGDRRRERARDPLLRRGRARRAADDQLAPVDATWLTSTGDEMCAQRSDDRMRGNDIERKVS